MTECTLGIVFRFPFDELFVFLMMEKPIHFLRDWEPFLFTASMISLIKCQKRGENMAVCFFLCTNGKPYGWGSTVLPGNRMP